MPYYTYKCNSCNDYFEVFHLMSEKQEECILCSALDSLEKVPSEFLSNLKKNEKDVKIGSLVETHIKESKQELEKHKKDLKNKTL